LEEHSHDAAPRVSSNRCWNVGPPVDQRIAVDSRLRVSLSGLITDYVAFYMRARTHLALGKDSPISRPVAVHSTQRQSAPIYFAADLIVAAQSGDAPGTRRG